MTSVRLQHSGPGTTPNAGPHWLRRTTSAAIIFATSVLWIDASPAAASGGWQLFETDGDSCPDIAILDSDLSGFAEDIRIDLDNDCAWDTRIWNTVGDDDFLEALTFDMNEDGHWEVWLVDIDQQFGFDVTYFDDDGDGDYDRKEESVNAVLQVMLNDISFTQVYDTAILINGCALLCTPTMPMYVVRH